MTMSGALIERLLRSASPRAASVADRQIADKAKEYLRRAHGFALAPRCEIAKPAACCALAAERFGRLDATPVGTTGAASSDGIDLARLQMLSGASAKVFEQTRAALRAALGVRPHTEAPDAGGGRSSSGRAASGRIQRLCLVHGCARVEPSVRRALQAYRERFVASLHPSRRGSADFSAPVFACAALFLVAKRHGLAVDRARLLAGGGAAGAAAVRPSDFRRIVASMREHVPDLLPASSIAVAPKRKRAAAEASSPSGDAARGRGKAPRRKTGGGAACGEGASQPPRVPGIVEQRAPEPPSSPQAPRKALPPPAPLLPRARGRVGAF